MSEIRLIVGLGNPGPEYQNTRHNAGIWLLDELASTYQAKWQNEGKFFGDIARNTANNPDILLLKPMTYMNLSGKSVAALMGFYKISRQELLVVHDELDLPPGVARFKNGGGHGGHNGLKNIIAQSGGSDFWRLRLGIGHPGDRNEVIGFVLKKPPIVELANIEEAIHAAINVMPEFIIGQTEKAINRLHTANK